jgi:hypothetical protein
MSTVDPANQVQRLRIVDFCHRFGLDLDPVPIGGTAANPYAFNGVSGLRPLFNERGGHDIRQQDIIVCSDLDRICLHPGDIAELRRLRCRLLVAGIGDEVDLASPLLAGVSAGHVLARRREGANRHFWH